MGKGISVYCTTRPGMHPGTFDTNPMYSVGFYCRLSHGKVMNIGRCLALAVWSQIVGHFFTFHFSDQADRQATYAQAT